MIDNSDDDDDNDDNNNDKNAHILRDLSWLGLGLGIRTKKAVTTSDCHQVIVIIALIATNLNTISNNNFEEDDRNP